MSRLGLQGPFSLRLNITIYCLSSVQVPNKKIERHLKKLLSVSRIFPAYSSHLSFCLLPSFSHSSRLLTGFVIKKIRSYGNFVSLEMGFIETCGEKCNLGLQPFCWEVQLQSLR